MNIPIIYSPLHKEHNPPFEIYDGVKEPYAEKAERIETIVQTFREKGITNIVEPEHFPQSHILPVHQDHYVNFLKRRSSELSGNAILYPSYFIMDTYTPITAKTYQAALSSADVALTGAKHIVDGERVVYSLCRPPGHHAEQKAMGGYCYFNNAAIAAEYLAQHGKAAILDVDFHHGNGTQNAFYERNDVLYLSIHADPKVRFPYSTGFAEEAGKGLGEGFNKNYLLPLGTTDKDYEVVLQQTLTDISTFAPKFLIISAGFDTYQHDPIGGFKLTIPFYKTMASYIMSLNLPTLVIQEGGYYIQDLGEIAFSFYSGLHV
jgi:acetoin utilization deacetylase AcuC-like enzyme